MKPKKRGYQRGQIYSYRQLDWFGIFPPNKRKTYFFLHPLILSFLDIKICMMIFKGDKSK